MKIRKYPLVRDRIRRPPEEGWSWIDRRFLREYAPSLEQAAILLYFFLAAVSDKEGLSYYSDRGIASRLRLTEAAVAQARDELERHDMIAFQDPLYQVLTLPPRTAAGRHSGPTLISDLLRQLATRPDKGQGGVEAEKGSSHP